VALEGALLAVRSIVCVTFFTTTTVGARLASNFAPTGLLLEKTTFLEFSPSFAYAVSHPLWLAQGLPFSVTLLTVLLAHEMGHYLTCRYYEIDASLPYFLPALPLSARLARSSGYVLRSSTSGSCSISDLPGRWLDSRLLLPALGIGLAFSKVIPGIATQGDLVFSTPWILRLLESFVFPGVPPSDIYLHPIARAAWSASLPRR